MAKQWRCVATITDETPWHRIEALCKGALRMFGEPEPVDVYYFLGRRTSRVALRPLGDRLVPSWGLFCKVDKQERAVLTALNHSTSINGGI